MRHLSLKKLTFYLLIFSAFTACASLNSNHFNNNDVCVKSCKITLLDGSVYEGSFKEGIPHGEGRLTTTNGDRYVGGFENGVIHGEGLYLFANGSKYRGDFKRGTFYGFGVLTRGNGDKYLGEFEDNQFHGKGILSFVDQQGQKKTLTGVWDHGAFDENQSVLTHQDGDILNPEVVLFYQYQLLTQSMSHIEPSRRGVTDLYFLSFGSDSHQDVFMNEALYTTALFESTFDMQNRTLYLINHPSIVHEVPIASVINLRVALQYIASQMDLEEDILFLYLTSHGSKDHTLSIRLGGVPLVNLPADVLAEVIKDSGIKWKVIAISACYSGGFIEHLKDDHTMVIASARADRTSFGCSDDSEMTYFGRAFFQYSLDRNTSFIDSFAKAKGLVTEWENESDFVHSEPQIHTSPLIEQKLREWRHSLSRDKQVMRH